MVDDEFLADEMTAHGPRTAALMAVLTVVPMVAPMVAPMAGPTAARDR